MNTSYRMHLNFCGTELLQIANLLNIQGYIFVDAGTFLMLGIL